MSEMICDQAGTCKESICGGKEPHSFDANECNHCPKNKDAYCVPVPDLLEATAARICLPHYPELWTTLPDEFKQVYLDEAKELFHFLSEHGVNGLPEAK